ncbi:MAG: DUF1641 domain-containing protein [Thermodesulfobacteriota bacterium]|nr:DUF1641 domain-containing protein [Thermodesulfobacteriota bacterium]
MTNEELILIKLDNIESQIEPAIRFSKSLNELKEDLLTLQSSAFKTLTNELQEIEAGFQLDDFLSLIKQTLRRTNDLTFAIRQLSNMVEFVNDLEPLLKSGVPQLIAYLDHLEQRGVFRVLKATLDIRAKVAEAYSPEDIDRIGDALVGLLGVTKRLSDPKAKEFIDKMANLPSHVDLEGCKKMGPFKLAAAACDQDVKEGLGVLIELAKAMGKLKKDVSGADDEEACELPLKNNQ